MKAILFDFDYTLVDSSEGIVHCFTTATNHLGLRKQLPKDIKKTIGMPLKDMFIKLYNENAESVDEFIALYTKEADVSATKMTRFYDDAGAVIQWLKSKGLKTGIVSTKFRYRIMEALEAYNVETYFDLVVGGEDVKLHKPSPEGIQLAMEALLCKPSDVIYVGDSIFDYEAAQNAKVMFIAVLNGETSEGTFKAMGQQEEQIARNLTEVKELIKGYLEC